jgi:hypothetical protein
MPFSRGSPVQITTGAEGKKFFSASKINMFYFNEISQKIKPNMKQKEIKYNYYKTASKRI